MMISAASYTHLNSALVSSRKSLGDCVPSMIVVTSSILAMRATSIKASISVSPSNDRGLMMLKEYFLKDARPIILDNNEHVEAA